MTLVNLFSLLEFQQKVESFWYTWGCALGNIIERVGRLCWMLTCQRDNFLLVYSITIITLWGQLHFIARSRLITSRYDERVVNTSIYFSIKLVVLINLNWCIGLEWICYVLSFLNKQRLLKLIFSFRLFYEKTILGMLVL